jgi:uncharacterized membrane protein
VIGWLYVYFTQRKSELAVFHLRQSIGLLIGLVLSVLAWGVVTWVLTWIPFGDVIGIALFTLVIAVWIVAVIALVIGLVNAARGRMDQVPFFGGFANWIPL